MIPYTICNIILINQERNWNNMYKMYAQLINLCLYITINGFYYFYIRSFYLMTN